MTTVLQSLHSPQASHMTTSNETMVTIPPEVVLILASSTVFVKASSLVNLDFGAIANDSLVGSAALPVLLTRISVARALGTQRQCS